MAGDPSLFEKFGQTVEAGKVIFREGEEGDQMFIIQSGKVKIARDVGGKEHILAVLSKGDFFGEMAIVNRVRRTATATAISQVQLLYFNREGFLSMIRKNAQIALNIIDKLCRRLQNANHQIQFLARRDARGLVAMNLRFAFQGAGEAGLKYERTVEDLAQTLDLAMEAVKVHISDLQARKILRLEDNMLRLLDPNSLNELAEHAGG